MISEAEFSALRDRFIQNAHGCVLTGPMETVAPAKRRGRMNKLETCFRDEVLEPRKARGEIVWYDFEAIKLRLADGAWYTPDFIAWECTGAPLAIECKGFWREAARVRIKVAADKYPFRFVAVTRDKKTGEWKYEHFRGGVNEENRG